MNAIARIVSILAALLLAAPAHAEPDDPAAAGRAAYALGHYAAAAAAFEEAFHATPTPALLYNAAQAHRLAGDRERALELYRNYVRVYGRKGKNYRESVHHIGVLEEELARAGETRPAPLAPPTTPPPTTPVPATPPPTTPPPAIVSAPAAAVVATPAPEPEPDRPLTHRAGFWVAVGVGVALAGGAIAFAFSRRQGDAPVPSLGSVPGN